MARNIRKLAASLTQQIQVNRHQLAQCVHAHPTRVGPIFPVFPTSRDNKKLSETLATTRQLSLEAVRMLCSSTDVH